MPSERIQRRIDALLDEADTAVTRRDWADVRSSAEAALALDPDNADARHTSSQPPVCWRMVAAGRRARRAFVS